MRDRSDCQHYHPGPDLIEVVNFLQLCSMRMIDIIEVGVMGMIPEQLLQKCVLVNEMLVRELGLFELEERFEEIV